MRAHPTAKQEAVRELLKFVKPGDTIYTTLEHVSRSGMQREIKLYKFDGGEPLWLVDYASKALDERRGKRDGLVVSGCGMDMGFHLVYSLSRVLFHDGFGCIGEGNGHGTRCPSNDHSNGDRDFTIHQAVKPGRRCKKEPCTCHDPNTDLTAPDDWQCSCGCARFPHWHNDGGYALRHRWL